MPYTSCGPEPVVDTTPTFIVFQKTPFSGIVINGASTDWCSTSGMGGKSGDHIKQITYNALNKLMSGLPVFTE